MKDWKYHLKELGWDLALGLGTYLVPLFESDDFSWSRHWWLILAGGAVRRIGAIVARYLVSAYQDRNLLD